MIHDVVNALFDAEDALTSVIPVAIVERDGGRAIQTEDISALHTARDALSKAIDLLEREKADLSLDTNSRYAGSWG